MLRKNCRAGIVLALCAIAVAPAAAQSSLVDLQQRHGIQTRDGAFDVAFDAHAMPAVPVTPGSFAMPLAVLTAGEGRERVAGAYAFGILAGPSGRGASVQELAAEVKRRRG